MAAGSDGPPARDRAIEDWLVVDITEANATLGLLARYPA